MPAETFAALVAYWQRVLRLQDWTIDATLRRHWDMGDGFAGFSTSFPKLMTAVIKVLDPADYRPGATDDVEQTLVHEMLHIRFGYLDRSWEGADLVLYEQAIEQMAWTMVRLNRGER